MTDKISFSHVDYPGTKFACDPNSDIEKAREDLNNLVCELARQMARRH